MPPVLFEQLMGASYTMISPKADCQKSINLQRTQIETGEGVGHFLTSKAPGLRPQFQPNGGLGSFRGNGIELNDVCTIVIDDKVYDLDSATSVKTAYALAIANDFMPVRFAASGASVMFVSAGVLYRSDGATITNKTFDGITFVDIAYIDSYYVAIGNGSTFYFSTDDGVTWSSGQSQTAEANSNNFLSAIVHQEVLFIAGNRVTQAFVVGANPNAPLSAQKSGVMPWGVESGPTLESVGKYRYWLGRNHDGEYVIYRAQGYDAQKSSNHALENKIRGYADTSKVTDAFAMVYQQNGQDFYRITFPSANASWELNATISEVTGVPEWNEVAAYSIQAGTFSKHRASCLVSAFGKILAGDYLNGWLYEMTPDEYTDFGQPQPALRRAPHIVNTGLKAVYDELRLNIQTGVGLNTPMWLNTYSMQRAAFVAALAAAGVTAAQSNALQAIYDNSPYTPYPLAVWPTADIMASLGFIPYGGTAVKSDGTLLGTPPQIGLQYSNNAAKTFSNILYRSLGMPGDDLEVYWQRLGIAHDKVFQLVYDAPCQLAITTGFLDATELAS